MLGDAGTINDAASYTGDIASQMTVSHSDASYTGDTGSMLSLDYFRSRAVEFQSTLNALDAAYQAAVSVMQSGADPGDSVGLAESLSDFDAKRYTMKLTAEAINAGAAAVNAAGGRFPSLSIPSTLGVAPIVMGAAAIAAIGTAGALIVWGREWLQGVNQRLMLAQALDAQQTPDQRASLAASVIQTQNAIDQANASGFGTLAPILKWGAIAIGAWFTWKAIQGMKGAA